MRVLIACEYSGTVRDAFLARGHDAMSCDLLPTDAPGPHWCGDVREVLGMGWDLMIAHPPCTHLAVSGARWFDKKRDEQAAALDFVRLLMDAPIERIAIENPVSIISSSIRKPDQIIQPWYFGHEATKTTCLWLKNLPPFSRPTSSARGRGTSPRAGAACPSGTTCRHQRTGGKSAAPRSRGSLRQWRTNGALTPPADPSPRPSTPRSAAPCAAQGPLSCAAHPRPAGGP